MAATATDSQVRTLALSGRREVAERTLEVQVPRAQSMTFKAGQFMDLTLLDPAETDAEGNTRGFSINSAPDDPELIFTTRLRDTAFKRVLRSLPLGTGSANRRAVRQLHTAQQRSPSGGPARRGHRHHSIQKHRATGGAREPGHRILLFYTNGRPEDAPFLDELYGLERENPRFTFVPTMTRINDSHASSNRGDRPARCRNDLRHTKRSATYVEAIYYIAGPPSMVAGLHSIVSGLGIDEDDIRTEDFSGY